MPRPDAPSRTTGTGLTFVSEVELVVVCRTVVHKFAELTTVSSHEELLKDSDWVS
ncbi:hypothetical protein GBF38_020903, partial [Nibea albiflora]